MSEASTIICRNCGTPVEECACPGRLKNRVLPQDERWHLRTGDFLPVQGYGGIYVKHFATEEEARTARPKEIRALIDSLDLTMASMKARVDSLQAILNSLPSS